MKFIKRNLKTLITHGLLLGLFYWLVFVLTPKLDMSNEDLQKIKSIDVKIDKLNENNNGIENRIDSIKNKIEKIDEDIHQVKLKKEIIREYYYEKINNVDKLTISELDSFFSKRYGY